MVDVAALVVVLRAAVVREGVVLAVAGRAGPVLVPAVRVVVAGRGAVLTAVFATPGLVADGLGAVLGGCFLGAAVSAALAAKIRAAADAAQQRSFRIMEPSIVQTKKGAGGNPQPQKC